MKQDRNHLIKMWVLVLQLGLTAIGPMVLCIGLGLILKNSFGLDYMLVLSLLGIVSGFVAAFRMAAKEATGDDEVTKLTTGIYDKKRDERLSIQEQEDYEKLLMEEYEELNRRREEQ